MTEIGAEWLDRFGLGPAEGEYPDWLIEFNLSTAPLKHWRIKRSKIKPDDLWFGIKVSRLAGTRATLLRRDEQLKLLWKPPHPSRPMVVAGTFLQKNQINWPEITNLDGLPKIIQELEQLLKTTFLREVEITATSLKADDIVNLNQWLSPFADQVYYYGAGLDKPFEIGLSDGNKAL